MAAAIFRRTDNLSAQRIQYIRQADKLSAISTAQALSEILPDSDKEKQKAMKGYGFGKRSSILDLSHRAMPKREFMINQEREVQR